MKTNIHTTHVIKLMVTLVSASMLMQGTPAQAFWPSDADTSFNAYNNAFYVSNGGNSFYKLDTGSGTGPGWWTLAEEIEMTEDSYNRTLSVGTKNMVSALCNGFVAQYG